MPLYPKNPKVVNKKEVVVTLVCGFLGLVACVLMVFQLCYTMLLCMEIPVYFTDGQFLVFFLLGFGTLLCLGGKVFISRHWKTMAFHGVITAIFSLITFLIWLFFL